jgi:hypothetical protein
MTKIVSFPPTREGWIAALRSGQFKQTQGTMIEGKGWKEESFCCLGVAYRICGDRNDYQKVFDLPKTLVKNLIRANDDQGWDFREIADYLETGKQPEGKPPLSEPS